MLCDICNVLYAMCYMFYDIYIYIYVYIHICIISSPYIYIYIYISYIYIYIYIYTYTYIHTYIHIYIYIYIYIYYASNTRHAAAGACAQVQVICQSCGRSFPNDAMLQQHLTTCGVEIPEEENAALKLPFHLTCHLCGCNFGSKSFDRNSVCSWRVARS